MESFLRDGGHVTASLLKDGGAGYNPGIGRNSAGRTLYAHSGLKNDQTQWEFDTASPPALDVTTDREYDAFGRTVASAGTWEGPLGYAGGFGYQSSSANYDFQLLGHRYYDPETGRFLTRDPIKDGRNWYVYCDSNPVAASDPSGLLSSLHTKTGLWYYYQEIARVASASGVTVWQHLKSTMSGGKTVAHHVFPKAKEFHEHWLRLFGKDWKKYIDSRLLRMPEEYHRLLHSGEGMGKGGWWNKQWRDFFDKNPDATAQQVYRELRRILRDADLNDVRISELSKK